MRTRLVTASVVVGLTVVLALTFSILGHGQQMPNFTPPPLVVNPDPSCFGSDPIGIGRYFDCGNGTVTDTVTGLIWLKQADCLGSAQWAAANQAAAGLAETAVPSCGLTDGSRPGDWRLPTKTEWETTIEEAALGCTFSSAPALTNDAGTACFGDGTLSSFAGVASVKYWSSAINGGVPGFAWFADLFEGVVSNDGKGFSLPVWPVRGRP